jgi:hypothetical protein
VSAKGAPPLELGANKKLLARKVDTALGAAAQPSEPSPPSHTTDVISSPLQPPAANPSPAAAASAGAAATAAGAGAAGTPAAAAAAAAASATLLAADSALATPPLAPQRGDAPGSGDEPSAKGTSRNGLVLPASDGEATAAEAAAAAGAEGAEQRSAAVEDGEAKDAESRTVRLQSRALRKESGASSGHGSAEAAGEGDGAGRGARARKANGERRQLHNRLRVLSNSTDGGDERKAQRSFTGSRSEALEAVRRVDSLPPAVGDAGSTPREAADGAAPPPPPPPLQATEEMVANFLGANQVLGPWRREGDAPDPYS